MVRVMNIEEFVKAKFFLVGEEQGFNIRMAKLLKTKLRRIESYSTEIDIHKRPIDPTFALAVEILVWLKKNKIPNPYLEV